MLSIKDTQMIETDEEKSKLFGFISRKVVKAVTNYLKELCESDARMEDFEEEGVM